METAAAQSPFLQLGKKLYAERMEAGLTIEECARFINRNANDYESFEVGAEFPSLIELEALAYLFDVLPESFWEADPEVSADQKVKAEINYGMITRIRRRTIGLNLRQARLEAGITLDETAERLDVSVEDLNAYEMGLKDIPLPQLAAMAEMYGVSLAAFLDRKSPIGSWAEDQRMVFSLAALPSEIKEFVARPINQPYLELAKKLSEMPVKKLRQIAEGILEITL